MFYSWFYCLINSHLTYGIQAWGRAGIVNINRVSRLHVRALTLIKDKDLHSVDNLLTFGCLYEYSTLVKMFEIIKLNKFPFFTEIFDNLIPNHVHETRFLNNFNINTPFHRLSKSKQSFVYSGLESWNKLPLEIRNSNNLFVFKKSLKGYLLLQQNL